VNAFLSFLASHRDLPVFERLGRIERASCVLLTPRFRTSRHVVGLLTPEGAVEPKLVVKMPRVAATLADSSERRPS
jgi:hypothetical protein